MLFQPLHREVGKGVVALLQLVEAHRLDLLSITGRIRVLEGIVLQGDNHFLAGETESLEAEGGVAVLLGVGLLIIDPVEKLEGQVILGLGHLHHRTVRDGQVGVALVSGMVIDHNSIHHSALLVALLDTEDIALDAVIEGPDGDFDLGLGTADIVAHRIDLVDRIRDETVTDIEGDYRDHCGCRD